MLSVNLVKDTSYGTWLLTCLYYRIRIQRFLFSPSLSLFLSFFTCVAASFFLHICFFFHSLFLFFLSLFLHLFTSVLLAFFFKLNTTPCTWSSQLSWGLCLTASSPVYCSFGCSISLSSLSVQQTSLRWVDLTCDLFVSKTLWVG